MCNLVWNLQQSLFCRNLLKNSYFFITKGIFTMKLSLAWLFDHIDADWRSIDIKALVSLFNKTTAEIEGFDTFSIDLKNISAAKIKAVNSSTVIVESAEWKQTIDMPLREGVVANQIYLIARDKDAYGWARSAHLGSEKEGLLPAFTISEHDLAGNWKKTIETEDVILHLDNKSINHRPDMWGHRGVAREVAAMLKLPFKAIDGMLIPHQTKEYSLKETGGNEHFKVRIEDTLGCRSFAGLYFKTINAPASTPAMAARLAKVDSRPINLIVDATNYVMLDLSQPMHAFDAHQLKQNLILVRDAKNKESIQLLDGSTVELHSQDLVITDGIAPVALAGIMGGAHSGVQATQTQSIFLESANFDPACIRKTATRVKKRTESSARFEKDLDPSQNVAAIYRFLKLLDDAKISFVAQDPIISIKSSYVTKHITVKHSFIEQQLGVSVTSDFVINTLQVLGFAVDKQDDTYKIVVPSYRATKDINIKQDIVEEIGRFYGYDTITEHLPSRITKPFDVTAVNRMRRIKQLLAYALTMRELYTYAFFDEAFLNTINWQPGKTLQVQEAVSQNWQRLVTTLIPNLLKAVQVHAQEYDKLSFFEWAKIWPTGTADSERACLAGIFVDQKQPIDFYDAKQKLCALAKLLGMHYDWVKPDERTLAPWYLPYQTASLVCDGVIIGTAGKVDPTFFAKVASGDAFIFEFDAHFLSTHKLPIKRFSAASKYPGITRDVSMLIPLSATVKDLRHALKMLDNQIIAVDLMDFFQKAEWHDQKSLTFRISMIDPHATMSSAQADQIMKKVTDYLQKQGAVIR